LSIQSTEQTQEYLRWSFDMNLRTEIERLYQVAANNIVASTDMFNASFNDFKYRELAEIKSNIDRLLDESDTRNI
jgi:hypothetical protein